MVAPPPDAATLQSRLNQAITLHQQGQLAQADALYAEVLAHQPGHAMAWQLRGVTELWESARQAPIPDINNTMARGHRIWRCGMVGLPFSRHLAVKTVSYPYQFDISTPVFSRID